MAVYDINGNIVSGGNSSVVVSRGGVSSPNVYDVNIKNVSHMGWTSDGATANTLQAYKESKGKGYYYVETDVRITSDGVAVLHHDDTDGGLSIASNTYADLLEADANLARFDDFITLCRHIILHPYIEIKPDITQAQAQDLYDVVFNANMHDRCSWIGAVKNLAKIVAIDGTQRVGVIRGGTTTNITSIKTDSNEVFYTDWLEYDINSTLITYCKEHGIPLEIYSFYDWSYMSQHFDDYITGVTHDTIMAGKKFYEAGML